MECKEKGLENNLHKETRENEDGDSGKMKGKKIRTVEIRTVKERSMRG